MLCCGDSLKDLGITIPNIPDFGEVLYDYATLANDTISSVIGTTDKLRYKN